MSSEPVGSEASVDPLVAEHRRQKRDVEEWHRRVREWQETVDAPLDRLHPVWSAAWKDLTETWRLCWDDENSIDTICEKLIRVAEQIRGLEAIRATGEQWRESGHSGFSGVSKAQQDWCRIPQTMTERFTIGDPNGHPLSQSFQIACRAIDLSLTKSKTELLRKLRELKEIPDSKDAALWLPFLGSILPPLNSAGNSSSSFQPVVEESEIDLIVEGVNLPKPSGSLRADQIFEAVRFGTWAIVRMDSNEYDEVRSRLLRRLDPEKKEQPQRTTSSITVDFPLPVQVVERPNPFPFEREKEPSNHPVPKIKRSTARGEGRAMLIAALTMHHKYANGSCLNLTPTGNNELARLAKVAKRTASAFFRKEFQGHAKYKALCRDAGKLAAALKLINGEYAPFLLYGNNPPEKSEQNGVDDNE